MHFQQKKNKKINVRIFQGDVTFSFVLSVGSFLHRLRKCEEVNVNENHED